MARVSDPRDNRSYKARRLQVLQANNWSCYYCGQDATQVDHVIPIANGGDPMSLDNLVAACKRCNLSKGKKPQGVFLATMDTPPAFPSSASPKTTSTVLAGPYGHETKPDE